MAVSKVVVVDASNVAHEELSKDGKPKISNILAVRRALEERGFKPIIIADASLWHTIDDPKQFDALVERQEIRQVPAGTDADFFILETAEQENAQVVSNDRFEAFQDKHPWIKERRVPVMIVEGQAHLYEPELASGTAD